MLLCGPTDERDGTPFMAAGTGVSIVIEYRAAEKGAPERRAALLRGDRLGQSTRLEASAHAGDGACAHSLPRR
jgi:hypothetical protein